MATEQQVELQLLMELLSAEQRQLFDGLFKSLAGSGSLQNCQERLQALLISTPYPTLQILRLHYDRARFQIGRLIGAALNQMLDDDTLYESTAFISLLANVPQPILEAATLHEKLLRRLCADAFEREQLLLALLARPDARLLQSVLAPTEQSLRLQCSEAPPTKQLVLQLALTQREHFVPRLCKQLKNYGSIQDATLRNNLLILRLADEFALGNQTLDELGCLDTALAAFDLAAEPLELHRFFYADFQRLALLLRFLRRHEPVQKTLQVAALLRAPGILTLVHDHGLESDSESLLALIESSYKWQLQTPLLKCWRAQELETLSYYTALCHAYAVIREEHESARSGLLLLSAQLRQLRSLATICALLEDILQLVFLRWEQLQGEVGQGSSDNGDNDDDDDEQYVDDETTRPQASGPPASRAKRRYGFICRSHALQALFNLLKGYVTKKLHTEEYKGAMAHEQRRFQRIVDAVNEAVWKFSVLQRIDKSLAQAQAACNTLYRQLEPEQLLQLVQLHGQGREKASSDDESRERCNYAASLTRRKSRKQRRACTFSGASAAELASRARAHRPLGHGKEGSIIPKMLGTPEQLAISALALKNFNDVKHIIENFQLQDSHLQRELQFMEQQQQIKQKLCSIYANYLQLEQQCEAGSKTTVEQIKAVAAKGFELSKIISLVDNFAQAQRPQQSDEVKQLLQRHQHYSFLQQYEQRHLYALIIADLIVNLRFNREITSNLLLLIRRQQGIVPQETKETGKLHWQKSQLPGDMGALGLLENLSECMRILERFGRVPALSELLSSSCHTLRPQQLQRQLEREAAFGLLYGQTAKDYGYAADLRRHAPHFQQLKARCNYYGRFCAYVQQLARLLQLRDANLQLHTTQLLKHDAYAVIGELIYEGNMTPLEIEGNVAALNLNLVHVIALNICPELATEQQAAVVGQRPVRPQKQESIHNYIMQQNPLLALLLQAIQMGELPRESQLDFQYIQQLIELPGMSKLAQMYGHNVVLAALNAYKLKAAALDRLAGQPLEQLDIMLLHMSGQFESLEQQQERLDRLIASLIAADAQHMPLVNHMSNLSERAQLLQQYFNKIQSPELIEHTLQHRQAELGLPVALRSQLQTRLGDMRLYARIAGVLKLASWSEAYELGCQAPQLIFEQLLQHGQFKLCCAWYEVSMQAMQPKVYLQLLLPVLLALREEPDAHLLRLLQLLPGKLLFSFLDAHKYELHSLPLMHWILDYLLANGREPRLYRNYQVSLLICEALPAGECQHFWPLLRQPLLIVEQLIMNAKFELLAKALPAARGALPPPQAGELCPYCFDKSGHSYDVQSQPPKQRFQLGQTQSEAFILLNFNLYQQDHIVGHECFDLLLRIYATKALDYNMALAQANAHGHSEPGSLQSSLDSLCGAFQMPKQPPSRQQWVRDEEASHCMCCRRAAFTMLMRRHHCRRCGRVVCYACSMQRMRIAELYDELEVRVCNDCHSQARPAATARALPTATTTTPTPLRRSPWPAYKWHLSGIITHDKLLREEFSYEHAPSVALSLSILNHHQGQRQCVELLLFHCRKLEKLIVPNPEVDYGLVAKMMNCLALAAKVRGAPAQFESICENSEILMAVLQQGCEALMPLGPLSKHNLRKLADALVQAEHWNLALELHLKYGFPTTGVMAAHGLACLRAGCYEAAREKFGHCLTRLCNEQQSMRLCRQLFGPASEHSTASIRRPQRGPPLLQEILKLIAGLPLPHLQPQPETLQRASLMRSSNSSLASLFLRRREPHVPLATLGEPALHVMNALASLKHIAKGNYGPLSPEQPRCQTHAFQESLHYVLSYGSHADVLQFLMQQQQLVAALKYWQWEQLETEPFIQYIFQPCLAMGQLPALIEQLQQLDEGQLNAWRLPLLQACRHLEQQQQLNSLYQLQLLLKDSVRASMTCVKFYALNCESFQQLHEHSQHLRAAHLHLQSELDAAQWEQRQPTGRRASGSSLGSAPGLAMQMDARALNGHINTIRRQMELAKFLAKCEREQGKPATMQTLKKIRLDAPRDTLPTLFEGPADKLQLCMLVLLCGKNIDEGFGLAYGIIQDYRLAPLKVFGPTAKYLARNKRLAEMDRLLYCIASNNGGSTAAEMDELLSIAINAAVHSHEPETKQLLDNLAKRISNIELRISSHIFIGQLKSAYLLANKYERLADIRKILRQAELTNQIHIKKLCEKKLNINTTPMAPTPL